jgi:hypothetical protein
MPNELDLEGLDELFNERTGDDAVSVEVDEEAQVNLVHPDDVDYNDPVEVLKTNIRNANTLLAKITFEMNRGNFSARMAEVASNILNSITAATKEIISGNNYQGYLAVRQELVRLKEREIEMKENKNLRPTSQNIIVTSREDLLKSLMNSKKKEIEHTPQTDRKEQENGE